MNPALERFRKAQRAADGGVATALAELRAGRKTSHWIWYVFPQLETLGRSETAKFYGIKDFAEACDYLHDAELRANLESVTSVVEEQLRAGHPLTTLMGGMTDALKLVSSLTLFEAAAHALNRRDATAGFARLANKLAEILRLAEEDSFSRCTTTRSQIPPTEV